MANCIEKLKKRRASIKQELRHFYRWRRFRFNLELFIAKTALAPFGKIRPKVVFVVAGGHKCYKYGFRRVNGPVERFLPRT